MTFDATVLDLDYAAETEGIIVWLRAQAGRMLHRRGVVVGHRRVP